MKKIINSALIMLLVICLAACTSPEILDPEVDPVNGVTTAPDGNPTTAPTTAPTATAVPTSAPAATPTTVPTAEPTAEPEPTAVPDDPDMNVSEDELLYMAYFDYLKEYVSKSEAGADEIRVNMGFVDGDDIPELFIADGSAMYNPVSVVTYSDKKASLAGEYGTNGSIRYLSRQNRLYSDMNRHGYIYLEIDHIENGVGAFDESFTYMYDSDSYMVGDKDVRKEEYDEAYERIYLSDFQPTSKEMYFNYEEGCLASDILEAEDVREYFSSMRNVAYMQENGASMFADPETFKKLEGTWNLDIMNYQHGDTLYYSKNFDYENSNCSSASVLSIENGIAGVWFSIYDEDYEQIYSDTHYALEMMYTDRIELEYDRVMSLYCDDYDDGVEIYIAAPDGNHITMIEYIPVEGQAEPDVIRCTYVRDFYNEDYRIVVASMEYCEAEDTSDSYAFNIIEQEFISSEDTELLAEYGYPDGLDGWDFVIEEKHGVQPYILYLPKENSDIYLTVLNNMLADSELVMEELPGALGTYGKIMYLYYPAEEYDRWGEDKSTLIPAAVMEPYLG